jgi:hypothetical protein
MPAGAIDHDFDAAERQTLHVGDHVQDREADDDTTLLVTGLPGEAAANWPVNDGPETVAAYNEDYPASDMVVQVVYPERTDQSVGEKREYSFPRSRLALEHPVHDRDEGGDA